MNKVLEELKAVQGVSGVMIMDSESLVTYQLLPANFEKNHLRDIAINLMEICQRTKEPVRIDLKFDNGVAFFTRFNRIVILVYGRPSLNLSLLKLVIKSSIRNIERKLKIMGTQALEKPEQRELAPLNQAYIKTLVDALNKLARAYERFTGNYLLTQNLRLAKEKLLKEFPYLSNFYVDNNGTVFAVKGDLSFEKEKVIFSFSRWASLLTELVCDISPETADLNIGELTKEIGDKLEEMGFYQLYEKKKTEKSLLGF